jgi:O-antigen/teichoic acid export membrane protein
VLRQGSLSRRLARNAGFTLLGRGWYLIVWFAVTPYVLDKLGPERFGVWSLLFLFSGYLAMFDLGLGASVIKFTAEHATSRDWSRLQNTLSEIIRIFLLLGIVWILAVYALHPLILKTLNLPPGYLEEVRFAILASAVVFAFANLVNTGPGIINGLQRMELSNGLLVAASLPQLFILIAGLHQGYGLYAVVASTAAQWLTTAVGAWFILRRVVPGIRWPSLRVKERSSRWLGFSTIMQVTNVLTLTQWQIDKILLTLWSGLRSVAEFELGFRVANGIQSLPVLALMPLMPAFSELDAEGERARFQMLLQRGTRLICATAFAIGACVIPVVPFLVRAWVGPEYPMAETLAVWLLAGFAVNLSSGVATAAARGGGRPGLEVAPGIIALILHVTASWFFIRFYGPVGAGPAFLMALCLQALLTLGRVSHWAGLPVTRFFGSIFSRPTVALIPAFLLGWFLAQRFLPSLSDNRFLLLAGCAAVTAISACVYAGLLWALGGVRRDRLWLKESASA